MGFRLWRRIRVAPGVTLNLSKSGLSTSIGHRGYHVTLGHGHIRNTVGIPGTGMYWTSVAGTGRRQTRQLSRRPVRRAPPPANRVAATPEENRRAARTALIVLGVAIAIVLTVITSGVALLPIGLGLVLFLVLRRQHRNRQPGFLAQQLINKAKAAQDPSDAVALLHEALDTDPAGKDTLLECASWFYDRQCWADATDAYAGCLHLDTTPYYEIRHVKCLIGAGHIDEAIAELEHLRAKALDESDQALVLSQLAMAFAMKGDPHQGLAFANEAKLQKRNLSSGAQVCLIMRGTCRYLTGQKAKGIEDLERVYAIGSSPEVLGLKTRMQNGTFQLDVLKPYPDWYPSKVQMREGPVVEEVPDGHSAVLATGAVSPDGAWRWSGSQWEPISETEILKATAPQPGSDSSGKPALVESAGPGSTAQPQYQLSEDSKWWWDGSAWKTTRSADGSWRWDGLSWVEA